MTMRDQGSSDAWIQALPIICGLFWWNLGTALAASIAVNDRPAGTTFTWESQTARPPEGSRGRITLKRQDRRPAEEPPVLHRAADSVFDHPELRPHWDGLAPDTTSDDEFRKALSTMDAKLLGEKVFDRSLMVQEIHYRIPEAEEVYFVWGINGWKPVPDTTRPPGTTLTKDKVMATRMVREGDAFVVRLRVPHGATVDYGFSITRTLDGAAVNVWDADKYPSAGYQTVAVPSHPVEISASLKMARLQGGERRWGVGSPRKKSGISSRTHDRSRWSGGSTAGEWCLKGIVLPAPSSRTAGCNRPWPKTATDS
ncbi:MAG: hypothetical protein E8D45_13135 [Nitrospira sp.]|nr:MAG: hypothetical protein E8D45_13135 [Nitrospira sp.]